MTQHPTDLALLEAIYDRFYNDFVEFDRDPTKRKNKILVPIDIPAIATHLNVDAELVFGRLYYHLEEKYGRSKDDGSRMVLFAINVGGEKHCVNFPMLASIVAALKQDEDRFKWPLWISIVSLAVSIAAILISFKTQFAA